MLEVLWPVIFMQSSTELPAFHASCCSTSPKVVEDSSDVLWILDPRLSTNRTFLIYIQLGCIAALSIATIAAVIRTQSETDTSRIPALAVVDNGLSIMMEDQVTNRAPITPPAS